jgi:hypothetical protein
MPLPRHYLALVALTVSGCLAEVVDTTISEARSPSGKWTATVVDRDAGVMTGSIIVFLHPSTKRPATGEALIAITDGVAPSVNFVNDATLRVRLFNGTKHNRRLDALGVTIQYE